MNDMNVMSMAALPSAVTYADAPPCEGAMLLPVRGVRGGLAFAVQDWVAQEVPVALEFNGISHAVMLATPADLEDFALGFSLSEGIVAAPRDVYGIDVVTRPNGVAVEIEIASEAFVALKARLSLIHI